MSVVLGYDDSPGAERALATAITVAKRFDERLVIVYGAAPPGALGEEYASHLDALVAMGNEAFSHAVARAREAGVETDVRLVKAKPAEALIEVAEDIDATLIIVGTYGEAPLRSALLGSTPHRLLHLSTRPVLVVPE
jgi:nucleotide-binding universal stress UspA family protein